MNLPGIFFFEAGMAWWLLLCEVMLTVSCLSEQNLPPLMLSFKMYVSLPFLLVFRWILGSGGSTSAVDDPKT